MGTVPGRPGSLRVSAKTRSWEQAESLARRYEITAEGGDEIKDGLMACPYPRHVPASTFWAQAIHLGMLRLPVEKQSRNRFRYLTSEKWWDSIANLDVLRSPRSSEEIVIGE
jgi:hypothetical protein